MRPRNPVLLMRAVVVFLAIHSSAVAQNIPIPKGYVLCPRSPNHQYGVIVPVFPELGQFDSSRDKVIDGLTGRVLGDVEGVTGWDRGLNFLVTAPPRWSSDSSFLLWQVDDKWGPSTLVLIHCSKNTLEWQLNLLRTAQQEILWRTRRDSPKQYLAAKEANKGSGPWFPEGFTVKVHVKGSSEDSITFPLKVHADLTSNPKEIEWIPELDSQLDAEVDKNGKFKVVEFQTFR